MFVTRLRFAVRAALFILIPLAGLSCDVLNPSFIDQLGGDAIRSTPNLGGSIVVVFNNQRPMRLTLSYDLEITRPGHGVEVVTGGSLDSEQGYWTATLDCSTTAVILTGIAPAGTSTTQPSGSGLALAVNEFRPPALQCGSVIFVNVPVFGSPTAEVLP